MNKEKFFELADEYIDADVENNVEYLQKVFKQIKNIYKNLKKENRVDFVQAMQIRGLRCTYYKNDFKIFYIDFE